jgi:hypothetical protein
MSSTNATRKANRSAKKAQADYATCPCCGVEVNRNFLPGHDARWKSILLKRFDAGDNAAAEELVEKWGWFSRQELAARAEKARLNAEAKAEREEKARLNREAKAEAKAAKKAAKVGPVVEVDPAPRKRRANSRTATTQAEPATVTA